MINYIDQAYYRSTDHKEKNAIYLGYNGIFEWILSKIIDDNLNLYHKKDFVRTWNCDNWPENIFFFDWANFNHNINIDFVLVNNRTTQAVNIAGVCQYLHTPLGIIDHELPKEQAKKKLRNYINSSTDKNSAFISPHDVICEEWDNYDGFDGKVFNVQYCFEKKEQKEKSLSIMSITDFGGPFGHDVSLCIKQKTHDNKIFGFNGGNYQYDSYEVLENNMESAKIYVGCSQGNYPPLESMVAASHGCAIVINKSRYSEKIFKDRENAILYSTTDELSSILKDLLNNDSQINELGEAGKTLIDTEYSLEDHRSKWNDAFTELSKKVYIR